MPDGLLAAFVVDHSRQRSEQHQDGGGGVGLVVAAVQSAGKNVEKFSPAEHPSSYGHRKVSSSRTKQSKVSGMVWSGFIISRGDIDSVQAVVAAGGLLVGQVSGP
ncbi:hypothetical protein [Mycobacterium uberis]|uniref:hypothetical protein n=1 Tax=Mycobacterium uberis TaxID=2162698 RepID=UPI000E304D88|nr:hypothetical protein [Mycobacterium uberis]